MNKQFEYDYSKLKVRIKKKYGTMTKFAEAMNCTKSAMSMRLNNQAPWKQEDISQAIILLNIPERQIYSFFYATKVKN
jgi:uncharacterized protein YaiE (UPF0345 family)